MVGMASLARAGALAVLLGAGACSLIVRRDSSQCDTTADCIARGPAFANSFCDPQHGCQMTCATNQDCSSGNAADPWICRPDHRCAQLLSEDCTDLVANADDLADTDTVWLGMLLPLDSATVTLSRAKEDAAELARQDFKVASGGLPPIAEGGARRHFAFVACNHSADPDRAARHLAADVGVPAIVGPIYSGILIQVATDVTIPAGVLLISPSATSNYITNLAGKNGLVWRTAPSDSEQAVALALLLTSLDSSSQLPRGGAPLKVAVAYKGDAYGQGLESVLELRLVYNGKDTAGNANDGNYKALDYGNPTNPSDPGALQMYRDVVNQLVAFQPHVVILAGTEEAITNVFAPLEQAWPPSLAYRPHYLMGDGAYPRPELVAAVGANNELRQRVLGTAPGVLATAPGMTPMLYSRFLNHYESVFHDGTTPIFSTAATYDAVYMLAYSIAGLGGRPLTGSSIAGGFARVVATSPDARFTVGPDDINRALQEIASSKNIALRGTSGPLAFDLSTGDTQTDVQVWCLQSSNAQFADTGLYYSATTSRLEGQLSCP
jgi:ABC-type branched-subunit amino acid transport system substrate-binding protein